MNKAHYYIGVMSGNSCDAIDAVLVNFCSNKTSIAQTQSTPIPNDLKNNINALCNKPTIARHHLYDTEIHLSNLYVQTIDKLLHNAPEIKKEQIIAIGNHGQTIAHQPMAKPPYSIQIGDPNIIAAKTGITTIMDFRRKDIALNGQGAPLAPVFHAHLFPQLTAPAIFINIGGISNLSFVDKFQTSYGYDIGPGNLLLDAWCERHQHKPFDKNGEWARTGQLKQSLLNDFLNDPFFKLSPPKSTGKEYFNLSWLEKKIKLYYKTYQPEDIQATLTHLSATIILQAISSTTSPILEHIYLCGGGAYNLYLLEILKQQCPSIQTTTALNLPPHLVEATGFAWLAKQRMESKPIDLRKITGASKPSLLGGIYEP